MITYVDNKSNVFKIIVRESRRFSLHSHLEESASKLNGSLHLFSSIHCRVQCFFTTISPEKVLPERGGTAYIAVVCRVNRMRPHIISYIR